MTNDEPAPARTTSLTGDDRTTDWTDATDRLSNADPGAYSHSWLATVRPDGRPHLMPIIAFWLEGAYHFVAGAGTQKGRNIATNAWCAIGTENRALPSLDVVVEGRAVPLDAPGDVRRVAEALGKGGWPLEARGSEVHGPHTQVAGPPPYRIYRVEATRAYGLPGNYRMFEVEPDELPKATRWDFAEDGRPS